MRIAVNGLSAKAGGGITFLASQFREWSTAGHFVTVAADPAAADTFRTIPNVEVLVPIQRRTPAPVRLAYEQIALPNLLGGIGPDVFYCPGGFAFLRRLAAPQVVVLQNSNLHDPHRRNRSLIELLRRGAEARWVARTIGKADHVVFISDAFRTFWEEVFEPPAHWSVVRSGVNTDVTWSTCPENGPLLTIGNIMLHKRIDVLLDGFARYVCAGGQRDLEIVGGPSTRAMAKRLQTWLDRMPADARSRVTLHGTLDRDGVSAALERSGVYVAASELEAFPLTPFEAMRAGRPVLLADTPPFREVADAAAAYFAVGDPASLADQLVRLDESRAVQKRLIEAGQSRVLEFSWKKNAERMVEIFSAASH